MKAVQCPCVAFTALSYYGRVPEAANSSILTLSTLEHSLRRCRNLLQFLQIHARMVFTGYFNDAYAASRLLGFATSSGFVPLGHAKVMLRQMDVPNSFSWNAVMRAYVHRGLPDEAVSLYKLMFERSGTFPDNFTHPIVLQACALRLDENEGKQVHADVEKMGFSSDVFVVNTLINMYSTCGNLVGARLMFDTSSVLDAVSWNSILAGYVQVGDMDAATWVFERMPERNTIASNSMIAMLGRGQRTNEARQLFEEMTNRDVVSWSAIISSYEQNGMYSDALRMFSRMNGECMLVDEVVAVSVLSACAHLAAIGEGELMHSLVVKTGTDCYVNLNNALINMYSCCGNMIAARKLFDSALYSDQVSINSMISGYLKCGLLDDAREFFDSVLHKDVVSWSTIISGYAQHNRFTDTLILFQMMQLEALRPDETTLVSVLSACAHLAALEQGKWVHAYIGKHGFGVDVILGTALVDMYMKCGCVGHAMEVFDGLKEKGVSTWNAAIIGLATNGMANEALARFSQMEVSGLLPNEITFVGVLLACRYLGAVDEGRRHFNSMMRVYKVAPNVQHYGCLVDILGRAGFLGEAEELVESMPMSPDVATWGSLLGACRKHGDTETGERIGRKLIDLEPCHDGFHVLLSNMYASRGKWSDVLDIRTRMNEMGVEKMPGCSLIEADGTVHEFLAGDRGHRRTEDIDRMLDEVGRRLRMEGYTPDTSNVTLNVDEEEKETSLSRHSEKLAIAFGLVSTSPPTPIRITKNLRTCNDCHAFAKGTSKVFGREIIVRDRRLYHHFKDGVCSCADYW